MELTTSTHTDPDGQAPWAMQMVARIDKSAPPAHTHVLEAAATATVLLLEHVARHGTAEDQDRVERWLDGRIRKVVRRATRPAAWAALNDLGTHATAHVGAATVTAFVPGPTDQVPDPLRKLQVAGLELTDTGHDLGTPLPDGRVRVHLNPTLALTTGKAAAQVAHAAQLVAAQTSGRRRDDWIAAGAPVTVSTPDPATWARIDETAPIVIHDAGFTEIPAGSLTCVAFHDL